MHWLFTESAGKARSANVNKPTENQCIFHTWRDFIHRKSGRKTTAVNKFQNEFWSAQTFLRLDSRGHVASSESGDVSPHSEENACQSLSSNKSFDHELAACAQALVV